MAGGLFLSLSTDSCSVWSPAWTFKFRTVCWNVATAGGSFCFWFCQSNLMEPHRPGSMLLCLSHCFFFLINAAVGVIVIFRFIVPPLLSVIWVRVGAHGSLHLCSRLIALSVTLNSNPQAEPLSLPWCILGSPKLTSPSPCPSLLYLEWCNTRSSLSLHQEMCFDMVLWLFFEHFWNI